MTRQVPLLDVTEFVLDGTHGSPERVASGIPLFSAQHVKDGRLNTHTDRFTSDAEYRAFTRRLNPRAGDVLLTIVGTIGRAAVLENDPVAVFQRSVAVIRPLHETLDSRFLFWAMSSRSFSDQLRAATNQSSQAGVYLGRLKKLTIPLPTLAEQRRIAAILDKADALRAKRRAALEQLNGLTQSVFSEMFGDPATNPKAWKVGVLGDVVHAASDGPHVSPQYVDSGVPFLSARHVKPGELVWDDLKFISPQDALMHWKKCKPQRGDILYTKGGTTGIAKAIDFDTELAVWVHIAVLKTNRAVVEPRWLEEMLNSAHCYAQSQVLTKGIANRDLGLKRMVRIRLFIPPIDIQRKFVKLAAEVEGLKVVERQAQQNSESLFASLQHQAFSGAL